MLLLSGVREKLPNGRNLREFLEQTGVVIADDKAMRVFPELDSAIEWVEERILGEREVRPPKRKRRSSCRRWTCSATTRTKP